MHVRSCQSCVTLFQLSLSQVLLWEHNQKIYWKLSLQNLINHRIRLKCFPFVLVVEIVAYKNFSLCFFLFRPVCGIRGKTLIINLPGSKKGSQVRNVLTDLLGRNYDEHFSFWMVESAHYKKFYKSELKCIFMLSDHTITLSQGPYNSSLIEGAMCTPGQHYM